MAAPLIPRFSTAQVRTALSDTPVVLLTGPRQCGKTTLVRELLETERPYFTLDDDTMLAAAKDDPAGFVRGLDRAIIDEVQRAPDLLLAIKRSVDDDRRPGRFLLTGSANLLALRAVSESLAGRMAIVELFPFSRGEVLGQRPGFLARALAGELQPPDDLTVGDLLVEIVLVGGYPEMLRRPDESRRRAWARDYLTGVLNRDLADIADIEKRDRLPRLFRVLAHHAAQLVNFSQVAGRIGIDDKTARRYVSLLEKLYIVRRLEPWFHNRVKRLVKTPKLHFLDSGLLGVMVATAAQAIARDRSRFGPLLETFVFSEMVRQSAWLEDPCALYHYRDKDRNEVDFVAEAADGSAVGVEVKARATVRADDFRGLRKLEAALGDDLRLGVVLYDGDRIVPFGERLFAAPVSCLWGS